MTEELEVFGMVLPLEGSYADLRRFLQAVEQSELFMVVERIGLREASVGGKLELDISSGTYFDAPEELLRRLRELRRRARGGV